MRLDEWITQRRHQDLRTGAPIGWAWATVDLERAREEADTLGDLEWLPENDALLGARGLRLIGSDPALLLLEPSTEGRLAGWLARNSEGEAVRYVTGTTQSSDAQARMTALGAPGVIERSANGPELVVVIRRP